MDGVGPVGETGGERRGRRGGEAQCGSEVVVERVMLQTLGRTSWSTCAEYEAELAMTLSTPSQKHPEASQATSASQHVALPGVDSHGDSVVIASLGLAQSRAEARANGAWSPRVAMTTARTRGEGRGGASRRDRAERSADAQRPESFAGGHDAPEDPCDTTAGWAPRVVVECRHLGMRRAS